MNAIVTGASGFIGQALLADFEDGHVWAISRSEPPASLSERVRWTQYPLNRPEDEALPEVPPDAAWHVMIHAAGAAHLLADSRINALMHDGNVRTTETAIRIAQAARVRHFVLISSIAAIDDEESAYGASKREAERIASEACMRLGIRCTIVRPVMVYGEGDRKGNLMKLMDQMKRGYMVLPNGGETPKPMIYVRNLTWIVRQAILHPEETPAVLNVREEQIWSVARICSELATAMNCKCRLWCIPKWSQWPLVSALRIANRLKLVTRVNAESYRKLARPVNVPLDPWVERKLKEYPYGRDEALRRTARWHAEAKR